MGVIHFNHMNATKAAHKVTENHLKVMNEVKVPIVVVGQKIKGYPSVSLILGSKILTGDLNSPGTDTSSTP